VRDLIAALTDPDRVVVRTFASWGSEEGILLNVATRAFEGIERLVGSLRVIERVVSADDKKLRLEVWPGDTDLDGFADPEAFPDWALFTIALQDENGEAPSERHLYDVAMAANAHFNDVLHSNAHGDRWYLASAGPPALHASHVPVALRGLVAALNKFTVGMRVIQVRTTASRASFGLAVYGAQDIRALSRLETGLFSRVVESGKGWMECKLLFRHDDSPRCDFVRHWGWAFFGLDVSMSRGGRPGETP
jgi:hypothetical protein